MEDFLNTLTLEDTHDYETTKPAHEAQQLLIKSSGKTLSAKEFVAVRDYLIVRLEIENG